MAQNCIATVFIKVYIQYDYLLFQIKIKAARIKFILFTKIIFQNNTKKYKITLLQFSYNI